MPVPDHAGFREAMVKMRMEFGEDVPFFSRVDGAYPPGVALDPETGRPFDPTVTATGSGWASAAMRVQVFTDTLTPGAEDDAVHTPVGWFEEGNIVLDADPEEYEALDDPEEVEWLGERYVISDVDGGTIGDVENRKLIYCRRR